MRRRSILGALAAIAAGAGLVPAADAQQKAMPVIGILAAASPDNVGAQRMLTAFRQGLDEAGFVEGQNVAIEYRWAEAHFDRLPALAAELVARKVDVIVTEGGDPSAVAAKQATSTIPVVFHTSHRDPVGSGLVRSLARPGGNLTGFSLHDLAAKRIELVSELLPRAKSVAVLVNPNNPTTDDEIRESREAARAVGVQIGVVKASNDGEIPPAIATASRSGAGALLISTDVLFSQWRSQLADLAIRYAIPTVSWTRGDVVAGALLSYGSDLAAIYRAKGVYVGKILKGAKPADLPVQRPTRFDLAINLKTGEGARPDRPAIDPRPRRRGHRMRRRDLILGLGGAAADWPRAARAQQKAMPVIGFLGGFNPTMKAQIELEQAAFRQGLSETGYVEGQNVVIEYRRGEGHLDRLPALAADLVARKVDVIVTQGGDASSLAAKNATSTIPILFHTASDPVAIGLVTSFARPGGNLTGVSLMYAD